jgi:hypothetical protein
VAAGVKVAEEMKAVRGAEEATRVAAAQTGGDLVMEVAEMAVALAGVMAEVAMAVEEKAAGEMAAEEKAAAREEDLEVAAAEMVVALVVGLVGVAEAQTHRRGTPADPSCSHYAGSGTPSKRHCLFSRRQNQRQSWLS